MDAEALEVLLAERACERLVLDYAALNDAADWDTVAALYVPEGRMSRPTAPDQFFEGHAAILAAFRARPPRRTRHVCTNIRVTLTDAETAQVSSQILLFSGPDQPPLVGSYADICVKTDAGWRFAERLGSLDFPPA